MKRKWASSFRRYAVHRHGEIYYPTLSGVARSINYYPIGSEKAEDGIVNIAFGLGKLIVEGGSITEVLTQISQKNSSAIIS